jgi:FkbM family methyltransferase
MDFAPRLRGADADGILSNDRCVLVDIGARGGLPAHWADVGPLLDVIAFEADDAEARRLSKAIEETGAIVEVCSQAVWDSAGSKTLNLARSPGCSSLYTPREDFLAEFPDAGRFSTVATAEVVTVPLDSVMHEAGPVRFVKIDAQGGALRILSGASAVLDVAVGLEIEVELAEMYDGEPLFGEVDKLLRSRGFELVDLRPTYWRREAARSVSGTRGQLVFADALYMLAPRRFAERIETLPAEGARHLAASACLVCRVYGLADWAAAYAATVGQGNADVQRMLRAEADTHRVSWLSQLPFGYPLGLLLKDIGDRLVESSQTWAVAEQRLGSKPRLGRHLTRRALRRIWRR